MTDHGSDEYWGGGEGACLSEQAKLTGWWRITDEQRKPSLPDLPLPLQCVSLDGTYLGKPSTDKI